jgi:hypothetical protein
MSLDASIAAARTSYIDNADYEATGSLAKAKAFVSACRTLLALPLTASAKGGSGGDSVTLDPTVLEGMMGHARRYVEQLQNAQQGTGVVHADFTDVRR